MFDHPIFTGDNTSKGEVFFDNGVFLVYYWLVKLGNERLSGGNAKYFL